MSTHNLDVSMQIFRQWCRDQHINEAMLLYHVRQLIEVSGEPRVLAFNCCPGDASNYIFDYFLLNKHKDISVTIDEHHRHDLLIVRDASVDGGRLLRSLLAGIPVVVNNKRIDMISGVRSSIIFSYGSVSFIKRGWLYSLQLQALPSFDESIPLHVDLWRKLLKIDTVECYGCSVNHPSQVQHMGFGGCLAAGDDGLHSSEVNNGLPHIERE